MQMSFMSKGKFMALILQHNQKSKALSYRSLSRGSQVLSEQSWAFITGALVHMLRLRLKF